jgi:hypothetical protein
MPFFDSNRVYRPVFLLNPSEICDKPSSPKSQSFKFKYLSVLLSIRKTVEVNPPLDFNAFLSIQRYCSPLLVLKD